MKIVGWRPWFFLARVFHIKIFISCSILFALFCNKWYQELRITLDWKKRVLFSTHASPLFIEVNGSICFSEVVPVGQIEQSPSWLCCKFQPTKACYCALVPRWLAAAAMIDSCATEIMYRCWLILPRTRRQAVYETCCCLFSFAVPKLQGSKAAVELQCILIHGSWGEESDPLLCDWNCCCLLESSAVNLTYISGRANQLWWLVLHAHKSTRRFVHRLDFYTIISAHYFF